MQGKSVLDLTKALIIGKQKFNPDITLRIAGRKFHPSVKYGEGYVIMCALLGSENPNTARILSAFGLRLPVYTPEGELFLLEPDEEGGILILAPKEAKERDRQEIKKAEAGEN